MLVAGLERAWLGQPRHRPAAELGDAQRPLAPATDAAAHPLAPEDLVTLERELRIEHRAAVLVDAGELPEAASVVADHLELAPQPAIAGGELDRPEAEALGLALELEDDPVARGMPGRVDAVLAAQIERLAGEAALEGAISLHDPELVVAVLGVAAIECEPVALRRPRDASGAVAKERDVLHQR